MMKEKAEPNVVSLFEAKKAMSPCPSTPADAKGTDSKDEGSFEDIMKRNLANKERLRQERLNANKSVLKSYRIKH